MMVNYERKEKPKFLWEKDYIDDVVNNISVNNLAIKRKKNNKYDISTDEIRERIRFVLLKFSNPYSRNKKNILRKYIMAFPDNQIFLNHGQIVKISKCAPKGNMRDALYVVLLDVFGKSEERLYNYVRNKLIDSEIIKGTKRIIEYKGGLGRAASCNASAYGKRRQFIGLSGGRGIEVPKNPILR